MKKKLNIIAFAIVVCVVSTLNVKIALNTNVLCDLAMTSINALGSGEDSMDVGENDFPTDPFPDSSSTAAEKVTRNYFEYSYIKLYENCYAKYKTRITEISCPGSGEVNVQTDSTVAILNMLVRLINMVLECIENL